MLKSIWLYIVGLIKFIRKHNLYLARTTLIILLLPLSFTLYVAFPNLPIILTILAALITVILLGRKNLTHLVRSKLNLILKGRFLYFLIGVFIVLNFIISLDLDNDGLSLIGEVAAGTDINFSDKDRDVLKDGLEYTNSKKSYFNPLAWDTNGNHISDFCDLIYVHKRKYDKSIQIEYPTPSEEMIRDICGDVLDSNKNFDLCNKSDSLRENESIILDIKCKNIVYGKITALRKANFTYYEQ